MGDKVEENVAESDLVEGLMHNVSIHCYLKIDDYAKDGGPEEVRLLCSFYHELLRT